MLIQLISPEGDIRLGLWQMMPHDCPPGTSARDRERATEHLLLKVMLGHDATIGHLESGKPVLDGWHISISHTRGYVALMLSRQHNVGVDIEYMSDRVSRVASRFMRPDEQAGDVRGQLECWSAKESLYKLFSADDLTYQEMHINLKDSIATNLRRGISLPYYKEVNSQYVLTYVFCKDD